MRTDSILHFNEGLFGAAGYAVPNHGKQPGTLNARIFKLTNLLGQSLFSMMHRRDVNMRVPPRVEFLLDVHRLYLRVEQLLDFAVPHNTPQMEPTHASSGGYIWKVWPVPYRVRNDLIRDWCGLMLQGISELFNHTENVTEMDFGPRLRRVIDPYIRRIYEEMAMECFGKTLTEAMSDGFLLTQADFDHYDPDRYFMGTERVDMLPTLFVITKDMLRPLRNGLLVTELPAGVAPFPTIGV